jgi:hypothetical protein
LKEILNIVRASASVVECSEKARVTIALSDFCWEKTGHESRSTLLLTLITRHL